MMETPRKVGLCLVSCCSFAAFALARASAATAGASVLFSNETNNDARHGSFRGIIHRRPLVQERATTAVNMENQVGVLAKYSKHQRSLLEEHNFFVPLTCNTPVCNGKRSTWTDEAYNPAAGTVIIPCGHCITFDFKSNTSNNFTLVLPFGLDIQGSLRISGLTYKSSPLTIITPFVRVQGKLIMDATRNIVGAEPNVRILLTDTNSGGPSALTSFVPAGNNRYACSTIASGTPTSCTVGNKPIVVAGGQLDIRGLPADCATWVILHDVVKVTKLPTPSKFSTLPATHPNMFCRTSGEPLMQQSFSSSSSFVDEWSAYNTAQVAVSAPGSLMTTRRRDAGKDGLAWDLSRLRGCLLAGQTYLFSFRVKFWSNAADGTATTCVRMNTNCLRLSSVARFATGSVATIKGVERRSDAFAYGEWNTFHTSFTFETSELGTNPIFHKFVLTGPEANVGIEIDDVTFTLPPPSVIPNPDDVCGGNLIMNGDASASAVDPYPMDVVGTCRLSVNTGFFRMDTRTSNTDSIAHFLDAPGCIVAGGHYKVEAKVRVLSFDTAVATIMTSRTTFQDGTTSRLVVAECPASKNTWVDCASTFTVVSDFDAEHVESIRFQFETTASSTADVDVTGWRVEFVDATQTDIVVQDDGVQSCWGNGAEILITSHTTDFESAQRRRLVADPEPYADGLVRLKLDSIVVPSVTEQDGDGFAVEVALLSRNFVFEGARDKTDVLMGGHLMVMNTPAVPQLIEGVELRNFGRQGEIGRYPIHFHMCADVDGSLVSKNSIRDSNQRCIVVHGTHNLTVSENVAHETKGHCFMLEDGGELDNKFIRNLGASTRPAIRVVRSFESDNSIPSTFWCSNPANTWIENVAAGSEGSGFWFELQDAVRSPTSLLKSSGGMVPRELPLKLFLDNVAHSNSQHGLRTYPIGYFPPNQVIFHNTRSYKNKPAGVFFHNSNDLKLLGGVLADNGIQADFDKADNIVIEGTEVMGSTARFNSILSSQSERFGHADSIIGLQLHAFVLSMDKEGATIVDVRFSGFADALSDHVALIEVDDIIQSGHFNYWTTLQGIRVADGVGPAAFDFRRAAASGIVDIVLTDVGSSMKPAGSSASGASSIISSSSQMKAFIDVSALCHDFSQLGYLYCRNTCFRTVTFATSPSGTDKLVLRVSDKTNPRKSFDFPGVYDYETEIDGSSTPEQRNTWIKKPRYFAPALPAGSYTAQFVDTRTGQVSWPVFVETTVERAMCSPALKADAVQLAIPSPKLSQCLELVQNGGMESSQSSYPYWLHQDSGIELLVGAGIGGTNAIADTMQDVFSAYIGQFIDTRCLDVGRQYDVRAWVRLANPKTKAVVRCDKGDNTCPNVQLRFRVPEDATGQSFVESVVTVASSFVRTEAGWNLLQGTVTIDSDVAGAASVSLVVRRGLANVKMYLDNVSMTLIR